LLPLFLVKFFDMVFELQTPVVLRFLFDNQSSVRLIGQLPGISAPRTVYHELYRLQEYAQKA